MGALGAELNIELKRKTAHVIGGLATLAILATMPPVLVAWLIGGTSAFLVYAGRAHPLMRAALGVARPTWGAWLFPLAGPICWQMSRAEPSRFVPALLILSVSDTLAALVGQRFRSVSIHVFGSRRSILGSTAFGVSAFLIVLGCQSTFAHECMAVATTPALLVAAVTTVVEIASPRGVDNLTVPVSTIALLSLP